MKRLFLFTILFCLPICVVDAQKRKPLPKAAPKTAAQTNSALSGVKEISVAEWNAIVAALEKENWSQARLLSSGAIRKLKTDNDKKQLARLRYFFVYALAGEAASGKITYDEFEESVNGFVGREFLMPSRKFLADCAQRVNYICPVGGDEKAVRATATDKSGSAIHLFEYVKLTDKAPAPTSDGRAAFVGGNLQSAEINVYKSNLRIMRLVFDRGFVNIIPN